MNLFFLHRALMQTHTSGWKLLRWNSINFLCVHPTNWARMHPNTNQIPRILCKSRIYEFHLRYNRHTFSHSLFRTKPRGAQLQTIFWTADQTRGTCSIARQSFLPHCQPIKLAEKFTIHTVLANLQRPSTVAVVPPTIDSADSGIRPRAHFY